jgi:hypothetical protein
MTFGLSGAPATFQGAMNATLTSWLMDGEAQRVGFDSILACGFWPDFFAVLLLFRNWRSQFV